MDATRDAVVTSYIEIATREIATRGTVPLAIRVHYWTLLHPVPVDTIKNLSGAINSVESIPKFIELVYPSETIEITEYEARSGAK